MSMSGGGGGVMADINVTPLVDVMLVLLVIFMITAPMIEKKQESRRKVNVDLPRTDAAPVDTKADKKLILVINRQLQFSIDGAVLTDCGEEHATSGGTKACLNALEAMLGANAKLKADREMYLMADKTIPYGVVVDAMARLKKVGVDQLGMVTDPPKIPKRKRKRKRR